MTTTIEDAVLQEAARKAGLNAVDVERLRQHANTIFLLRSEGVVARLVQDPTKEPAAQRAVAITRWLVGQGFPATEPASVEQPVRYADWVVTFWKYYPQERWPEPPVWQLGALLRRLHALPAPPIQAPAARPLSSFLVSVENSTFLDDANREWLLWRRSELLSAYDELDFPLGHGFLHGDAYPGNLLWDGDQVLLGDWDEVAFGPRELDLANTYQGVRFGRTSEELAAFADAYGYDIGSWTGLPVLRSLRDLHTLGAYIRLADTGNKQVVEQLQHRIATLRAGDDGASWLAR
ncbi:phosphotransferase family protein [Amycolatopsis sp. NPDC059657]|uniref:phosphotransferase family protein n=1 Tax=Amycolatopsis sp. NPDC059657 TaxID=3346899 RepID=UPI00366FD8AB